MIPLSHINSLECCFFKIGLCLAISAEWTEVISCSHVQPKKLYVSGYSCSAVKDSLIIFKTIKYICLEV